MVLEMIDGSTLLVNKKIKFNITLENDSPHDIIGFYRAQFPIEVIQKWILHHGTFKLPYLEPDDLEATCNLYGESFSTDYPDFIICMYSFLLDNYKEPIEIEVFPNHILWVIHDLFHADEHCFGDTLEITERCEYDTHVFTFNKLQELKLLKFNSSERDYFEQICKAQNDILKHRHTKFEDCMLNLEDLIPNYVEILNSKNGDYEYS